MPIPAEKRYTVEEFYALDIDEPCELINGKIYTLWENEENEPFKGRVYGMLPPRSVKHQQIAGNVVYEINCYIKSNRLECEVFHAANVKLNDEIIIVPDIFVTRRFENFDKRQYNGAPEWIIEVTAPNSTDRDYREKYEIYRNNGVEEYWIIDSSAEKITVYNFAYPDAVKHYTFSDRITAGIFKDKPEPLTVCLNEIL